MVLCPSCLPHGSCMVAAAGLRMTRCLRCFNSRKVIRCVCHVSSCWCLTYMLPSGSAALRLAVSHSAIETYSTAPAPCMPCPEDSRSQMVATAAQGAVPVLVAHGPGSVGRASCTTLMLSPKHRRAKCRCSSAPPSRCRSLCCLLLLAAVTSADAPAVAALWRGAVVRCFCACRV